MARPLRRSGEQHGGGMMAAAKEAKKAPAKASVTTVPLLPGPGKTPPALEQIPITHHAVSCALSKAEAARELLDLAYEHLEDDDDGLSWSRIICLDAIDEALKAARVAYAKAVGDKTAVAS